MPYFFDYDQLKVHKVKLLPNHSSSSYRVELEDGRVMTVCDFEVSATRKQLVADIQKCVEEEQDRLDALKLLLEVWK